MQARRIAAGALGTFFHNEFAALALVSLEALIAHRRPAFGAVEQIADAHVDRIAGRSHRGRGRSSRRRRRRSRAGLSTSSTPCSKTYGNHTTLPDAFAAG